jgi:hypothetical protein
MRFDAHMHVRDANAAMRALPLHHTLVHVRVIARAFARHLNVSHI